MNARDLQALADHLGGSLADGSTLERVFYLDNLKIEVSLRAKRVYSPGEISHYSDQAHGLLLREPWRARLCGLDTKKKARFSKSPHFCQRRPSYAVLIEPSSPEHAIGPLPPMVFAVCAVHREHWLFRHVPRERPSILAVVPLGVDFLRECIALADAQRRERDASDDLARLKEEDPWLKR